MIQILYISSNLRRTGPTNILYNLIEKLDRQKFLPIVLTLSEESRGYPSSLTQFQNSGIEVHCLNISRFMGFFRVTKLIKHFVKVRNIQIIHIFGFRGDFLIRASDFRDTKILTSILSNIYDDYIMLFGKIKGKIIAYLHIKSLTKKIVVGCSEFVAVQLYQRYKININVIYNGIPKEHYKIVPIDEKNNLRILLGLPINKPIFLFVGYLIYRKDPITVLKAFIKSKSREESILLIIGDGPLMQDCKNIASSFSNIIFLGNTSETIPYLQASDYYISSAYSEGLPTSVMEAMGCGLPVILSNIQPHFELVRKIKNWNYLFPINNIDKLVSLIDEIIKQPYFDLSTECRKIIDQSINSEIMASEYQKFYID